MGKIKKFYSIKHPKVGIFFIYVRESRREVIDTFLADGWLGDTWDHARKTGYRTVEVVVVEAKNGRPQQGTFGSHTSCIAGPK